MNTLNYTLAIGFTLALLSACGPRTPESTTGSGHGIAASAAEPEKGPHRGRLLTDGDFSVEVVIFEAGVPPEYHVYPSDGGKPVDPGKVKLTIELSRLDGKVDRFAFSPVQDFLKGDGVVTEPHSFDVNVQAEYAGQQHRWTYDSYEGRTSIADDVAAAAGVKTATAGPGVVRESLSLYGSIVPNAEQVRSVVARFPGPIRSVAVRAGDRVTAGQSLATVESNESLQVYTITAPIGGVVTERRTNPGEAAGSDPLFVIADFSSVWAELTLFARDRSRLTIGQGVVVTPAEGGVSGEGRISYISPLGTQGNQSLVARVVLDNRAALWTPGVFVTGTVTVGETAAPLVVRNTGLQPFRDFTVVFAKVGNTYEVRMLDLGKSDGEWTEVLGGLDPGTEYVSENSYLIKADIEKSGASHDH